MSGRGRQKGENQRWCEKDSLSIAGHGFEDERGHEPRNVGSL